MSFQQIRAHIESRVNAAFQNLSPPVEVVWDNVQETPPAFPYIDCTISYTNVTQPTVSPIDGVVEQITGNLQIVAYVPRGRGMKDLELYGQTTMQVMNNLYEWGNPVKVKAGPINGPNPLLSGDQPYALVNTSCAFTASVS